MSTNQNSDKPKILEALDLILADPEEIKRDTEKLINQYKKKFKGESDDEINDRIADKIISNYSYYAAFVGGTTALAGVVPGIGTAVAVVGGASADAALTMKFQIEMVMAIAVVYDHDITNEEEKRLAFIVAGLGTVNEAAKEGGKRITSKAFVKMTQNYLKGATLVAVKEIFKKVGVTFTRKAVEKAIPFGVGVIIGVSANKGLTFYVGHKSKDFYKIA